MEPLCPLVRSAEAESQERSPLLGLRCSSDHHNECAEGGVPRIRKASNRSAARSLGYFVGHHPICTAFAVISFVGLIGWWSLYSGQPDVQTQQVASNTQPTQSTANNDGTEQDLNGNVVLLEGCVVMAGVFFAGIWFYWQRSDALERKYSAQAHFRVGKYLAGLDNCNDVTNDVECIVAPGHFVFTKRNGQELGIVPRDAIEEVAMDDKSQITQRLTATRMIALNVFALAAPKNKKIKEWCVAVRWVDGKGLKRATVFEFSGSNPEAEANRVANTFIKYTQQRTQRAGAFTTVQTTVNADSKTCPFCAETIKAAAMPVL
jgi:hypothetical protein